MSDVTLGPTSRESSSFAGVDGARIHAWLYRPDPPTATGTTIVMAHGIGGIKSAGLAPIAERFAGAGHTCVVFDYRHFGASEGSPRELLRIRAERDDYRSALKFARELPETTRTVVWGCSFAGCMPRGTPSTTRGSPRSSQSARSSTGRTLLSPSR